jgi:hypothetical protein
MQVDGFEPERQRHSGQRTGANLLAQTARGLSGRNERPSGSLATVGRERLRRGGHEAHPPRGLSRRHSARLLQRLFSQRGAKQWESRFGWRPVLGAVRHVHRPQGHCKSVSP